MWQPWVAAEFLMSLTTKLFFVSVATQLAHFVTRHGPGHHNRRAQIQDEASVEKGSAGRPRMEVLNRRQHSIFNLNSTFLAVIHTGSILMSTQPQCGRAARLQPDAQGQKHARERASRQH